MACPVRGADRHRGRCPGARLRRLSPQPGRLLVAVAADDHPQPQWRTGFHGPRRDLQGGREIRRRGSRGGARSAMPEGGCGGALMHHYSDDARGPRWCFSPPLQQNIRRRTQFSHRQCNQVVRMAELRDIVGHRQFCSISCRIQFSLFYRRILSNWVRIAKRRIK